MLYHYFPFSFILPPIQKALFAVILRNGRIAGMTYAIRTNAELLNQFSFLSMYTDSLCYGDVPQSYDNIPVFFMQIR